MATPQHPESFVRWFRQVAPYLTTPTHGDQQARQHTRARILLKADEGPHGEACSDALIS